MPTPIKVGITGGIGCGKTYVCELFKKKGIEVYNTDDQVKSDIIRRDAVKRQVIAEFGGDSYLADGSINRDKFRKLLFNDLSKKSIMDKIVGRELIPAIDEWMKSRTGDYVLLECAVLFENGVDKFVDCSIVVTCPRELRIERLLKRGVAQKDIDNIMSAQWSEEQKIEKADFVINNGLNLVENEVVALDKILRIYAEIMANKTSRTSSERVD